VTIHKTESRDEWLKLRHKYVSSTEQAALHGLSPYITAFELYHDKKKSEPTEFEQSERMQWGQRQEESVARGIAEDYGVKVRKLNNYVSKDGTGMGASFDYEIVGTKDGDEPPAGNMLRDMYDAYGPGILEIKTVDWLIYKRQWKADDEESPAEAPPHIEIQVQAQLHVIERKWAAIGVLVGGNSLNLLVREYDPDVGAAMELKTKQFWKDIAAGKTPAPTLPQDADLIAHLYSFGDPAKVLDAQGNAEILSLLKEYADAQLLEKGAENRKQTAKAKLLMLIGDASRVIADEGYKMSAGTVAETTVPAYTRKAYRLVRVTKGKQSGKDD
jgi:putative phage-type endonuclease